MAQRQRKGARPPAGPRAVSRRRSDPNNQGHLAAAHLDHDPGNNRPRNLKALCQRCHMLHDRDEHQRRRWLTLRRRNALGDLFLGPYPRAW